MAFDEKLMWDDLVYHDEMYAKGTPEISDTEYDLRRGEFRSKFPNHPYNQIVGSSVVGEKTKLPFVLGSLNKTKTDGSCQSWMKVNVGDKVYWTKLDGVSGLVQYVDGVYYRSLTRGDGEYGTDITDKLRDAVPNQLKFPTTGSYRCEIMLTGNVHKELGYKTRRNGAAGIINRDGVAQCEHLTVLFYEVVEDLDLNTNFPDVKDEYGRILRMKSLGLDVAPYVMGGDKSDDELVEILRNWKTEHPFDIDGIVMVLNESEREDTYYPDHKVAFKVNEEATTCDVVGLTWQVGRTGRVVPVVNINPTEIGGVTVSNTTGFNAQFVLDNGVDKGAKVGIYRSGDVIPYLDFVVESVDMEEDWFCPSCGDSLVRRGVDFICDAPVCVDRDTAVLEHSLTTLGCENITAVTLKKLGVTTMEECYDLDELEISQLDGFGIKRAQQIIFEINKTLSTTPAKLLASFGISGIGNTASQNILKVYEFDQIWGLQEENLKQIDGIGDTLAYNFVNNINDFYATYSLMKYYGLEWSTSSNSLMGKTFCLTGNGTVKRPVLQGMIEANGGYVKGMSKKVDVLVCNDPNTNSGKAKKARGYIEDGAKIDIISYEELMEILEA